MSDNLTLGVMDENDFNDASDGKTITDFTQVASCAVGDRTMDGLRISLRDKLERERAERQKQLEKTLTQSFRNLLKGF